MRAVRRRLSARWAGCWAPVALAMTLAACDEGKTPQTVDERPPGATGNGPPGGEPPEDAAGDGGQVAGGDADNGQPMTGPPTTDLEEPSPRPAAEGLAPLVRPPRANTRIHVRVLGTTLWPAPGAVVHARGRAMEADSAGLVVLEDVYGADAVDLFAVEPNGPSGGHVRVPLTPGQAAHHAILIIGDASGAKHLEDLGAPVSQMTGPDARPRPDFALATPAEALRTSWDGPARGQGHLRYRYGRTAPSLWAAPGGLRAWSDAGSPVDLWVAGTFEVDVAQGGSPMHLAKPARVSTRTIGPATETETGTESEVATLPDAGTAPPWAPAGEAPQTLELYRFEPGHGLFVHAGEGGYWPPSETTPGYVSVTIDVFGSYVVGRPAAGRGCHVLRVTDGAGTPLSGIAVRARGTHGATSTWTDAAGLTCLRGEPSEPLQTTFYGSSGSGDPIGGTTTITTSMNPAECESACGATTSVAATPLVACVQGSLLVHTTAALQTISEGDETSRTVATIPREEPFCHNVAFGKGLELQALNSLIADVTCDPVTQPSNPGRCGTGGCLDLGELRCCASQEACLNNFDDDCDGAIDENCVCGEQVCPLTAPTDHCCTSDNRCGFVGPLDSSVCLAPTATTPVPGTCPTEQVGPAEASLPAVGCCLESASCGIVDDDFGCVPREQAHAFFELAGPLSAVACTP